MVTRRLGGFYGLQKTCRYIGKCQKAQRSCVDSGRPRGPLYALEDMEIFYGLQKTWKPSIDIRRPGKSSMLSRIPEDIMVSKIFSMSSLGSGRPGGLLQHLVELEVVYKLQKTWRSYMVSERPGGLLRSLEDMEFFFFRFPLFCGLKKMYSIV